MSIAHHETHASGWGPNVFALPGPSLLVRAPTTSHHTPDSAAGAAHGCCIGSRGIGGNGRTETASGWDSPASWHR